MICKCDDIGALTERLTIQTPTVTTDTHGTTKTTGWTTLATVWGRMRPLTVREQLQAEQVGSHMSYEAEIRYRADVTPKMRVLWTPYDGSQKTFEIAGVVPKKGQPARTLLTIAEVV